METWEHQGMRYRVFYQGKTDSFEGQNVLQRRSHRDWHTVEEK